HTGNGGSLLPDGDIDTIYRLTGFEEFFLIDDGVDSDRRFTRLTVADDQLTLTTANGDHGVDSLDARLQRLFYRLTKDYAGGLTLQRHLIFLAGDRAFTVDGLTKGIDYASEHAFANLYGSDLACATNGGSFYDVTTLPHQYHTHVVFFQVERDGPDAIFEFHEFAGADIAEPVYTSDTIAHLQYGAHLFQLRGNIGIAQLLTQYR